MVNFAVPAVSKCKPCDEWWSLVEGEYEEKPSSGPPARRHLFFYIMPENSIKFLLSRPPPAAFWEMVFLLKGHN